MKTDDLLDELRRECPSCEECEDVNEWMREHGVSGLGDLMEGLPASGKPEETSE